MRDLPKRELILLPQRGNRRRGKNTKPAANGRKPKWKTEEAETPETYLPFRHFTHTGPKPIRRVRLSGKKQEILEERMGNAVRTLEELYYFFSGCSPLSSIHFLFFYPYLL